MKEITKAPSTAGFFVKVATAGLAKVSDGAKLDLQEASVVVTSL